MATITEYVPISTQGQTDIVDITPRVVKILDFLNIILQYYLIVCLC